MCNKDENEKEWREEPKKHIKNLLIDFALVFNDPFSAKFWSLEC